MPIPPKMNRWITAGVNKSDNIFSSIFEIYLENLESVEFNLILIEICPLCFSLLFFLK